MHRAALASLLFLGMLLTPVHAQRDTTARLAGTVRSSVNGLPISGVMIAVKGSRVFNVSDATGSFTLGGLPAGRQTVRIRYGDSLSYERDFDLKQGKTLTLSVLLDVAATELAPIVVEAQTLSAERSLAGFYDRKKSGFGRYYTLADLKRRPLETLQALLLESAVQVRCRLSQCLALGSDGGRACVMSLFLDGLRMPPDYLNVARVDELAAVEVYKIPFEVPQEFSSGLRRPCGAVLMWSRH
jgi:Carboxypeptidase regulatory-like domain